MQAEATEPGVAAQAAGPAGSPGLVGARQAGDARWPLAQRIGFRFLALYFVLYTAPFPLGYIPWLGDYISQGAGWLWRTSAPWVGARILGIEGEMYLGPTGSGDTTFDYVKLLMIAVLALTGTVVWSLIDRRRPNYPRAARWLVVGCRYYLGLVMLTYGFGKVIPAQFGPPSLTRLLTPYGDSSPMGIVWTFMGLSAAYTIFGGLGETVGGLLLFFRRTCTLGALALLAVMGNVVMLNFSYDVPVKLYSSHLLAMAIALVLLDRRRLAAVFLRNATAPPADQRPLFDARRWNLSGRVLGLALVAWAIYTDIDRSLSVYRQFGRGREKPAIWGIHDVERFAADGEDQPPLLSDMKRWRALVVDHSMPIQFGSFERPGRIAIQHMNGKISHHPVELDEDARTFTFLPEGQMSVAAAREAGVEITDVLRYERPWPDRLLIRGTWQGREVEIETRQRDLETMELVGRGFHWINELPRNR